MLTAQEQWGRGGFNWRLFKCQKMFKLSSFKCKSVTISVVLATRQPVVLTVLLNLPGIERFYNDIAIRNIVQ
jgi:hypothetical protein